MNTYTVYVGGNEQSEYIKAATHNSAEKKAQKKYAPSPDQVRQYMRVNPCVSEEEAKKRLSSNVSVAYTEI